jgi:hypothetical protein
LFGVTNVIRFFRNRMYHLYDEKTGERFTELDKGETADFKTLKNFKRLRKSSRDLKDFLTLLGLHQTSENSTRLRET